jgi:ubiquinone/menaquinone biosynthesis C-methylase UbiE
LSDHICPVWVGYLLASPLRKLFHNPQKIIGPYIREGMTVLDAGSAMGFFSIPAAKMVGERGTVICVDCQEPMLASLKKRARKAGVASRIQTRVCSTESLGVSDLAEQVDLVMAIAMIHEAIDPARLLGEIAQTLKSDGRLLISEPKSHVTSSQIDETLRVSRALGLIVVNEPMVKRTYSFLMKRAA